MANERIGVYMDMMVSKYTEQLARLYLQKHEREEELQDINKEIYKLVGAIGSTKQTLDQLEKIHQDMSRESRIKAAKKDE